MGDDVVTDTEVGSASNYPTQSDEKRYAPEENRGKDEGFLAKLQRFTGKYGVEQRGIEPVLAHERTDTTVLRVGTLWFACNISLGSLAIGVLAVPAFGLGFVDASLVIVFVNILGILPVCWFSTFGARFGLRQMVLSRFYFGYYGVKLAAFLNGLACLGWSAITVIVGAQLIPSVNNDVPGWAAIVIIGSATFFVSLFGYKVVHIYESYCWIPTLIIFMIILGIFTHSGDFENLPLRTGTSKTASILSFSSAVFGFAAAWSAVSSDYCVYQPVTVSRKKIFFTVFYGLLPALLFTQLLGLAIATATANNPEYAAAYNDNKVGGLLAHILFPHLGNFGKFCLVVLALSTIGNNIPNIYSLGFSLQILHSQAQRIPRYVWSFVGSLVYIGIAIPGYSHFETVLESFMLIIGYWAAIYQGISLGEHVVFRRGTRRYNVQDFDTPSKLPPSFAAIGAFCCGIMGVALGMSQIWFVGPISRRIDESGADIGFELAFGFTFISYILFRMVERSYFRR
ncbi:purine cytosine permease Fcy2 [Histoplasma capsulatum G186AR]|uniref:Purine cytosine permease Fcy2 n=1 Tax=Ajellomyces capsulatus (strain G186AR / H82 / ATCC MYA-2454 / RMSCC 2432) TaxID=447093 RepID=C0NBC5_AJECG|nr:purine cytosine permease Fcy2 [Histoplasma capsulatum G186AR]EEH10966.1 purine cytosine permease Fcy2 [Histoplasma capsulatum G186AR]